MHAYAVLEAATKHDLHKKYFNSKHIKNTSRQTQTQRQSIYVFDKLLTCFINYQKCNHLYLHQSINSGVPNLFFHLLIGVKLIN